MTPREAIEVLKGFTSFNSPRWLDVEALQHATKVLEALVEWAAKQPGPGKPKEGD